MADLNRKKVFTFKKEEYTIEFPTVGEYMEIENQKLIQSNGQWINLIKNQTVSALRSIQIIECVSILMVLCPKLFGNMKVTSYKEIDAIDFIELLTIYNNEISPWYGAWFKQFNEVIMNANKELSEGEKEE